MGVRNSLVSSHFLEPTAERRWVFLFPAALLPAGSNAERRRESHHSESLRRFGKFICSLEIPTPGNIGLRRLARCSWHLRRSISSGARPIWAFVLPSKPSRRFCSGAPAFSWPAAFSTPGFASGACRIQPVIIGATPPLWFVLLDWLRPRGARPSLHTMLGIVVGFAGMAMLVGGPDVMRRNAVVL